LVKTIDLPAKIGAKMGVRLGADEGVWGKKCKM